MPRCPRTVVHLRRAHGRRRGDHLAGVRRVAHGELGLSTIRRADPADLSELVDLSEEFCLVDGHPFDRDRVSSALGTLLAGDTYGEVWVVSDEGGLVGYCVITWGYSLESGGRECLLDEMYVSEPGSGTGSLLLDRVIVAARDRGFASMFLETEIENAAARRFYSRHGFEVEDSVWMSLDLGGGGSTP